MPRGRMCSTCDVAQHPGYDIFFHGVRDREWLINGLIIIVCSFAFLTFRLNYGWKKHDRRVETKEEGKRQRKTKGEEEKRNGGEAERERLRGARRNSSKEQCYGGQVQLSSFFLSLFY